MTSYYWIKCLKKYQNRLLLKCFKMRVVICNTKEDTDYFYILVEEKDYSRVQKLWFVTKNPSEVLGMKQIIKWLDKWKIFIISMMFGFLLLGVISNIMIEVEVIHSKKEIRDLVAQSLEENGIKKNSWRKNYQELNKIKELILNQHQDKLEWMEIESVGMKYIVRIEERKKLTETKEKEACHIIAKKDGIIKYLVYNKGEGIVRQNDVVKEGDILIQGIIKKDDEEKGVTCASGEVYAEVWYNVEVSVPMNYELKQKTGKKRKNIRFTNSYFNDFIFKSRVKDYQEEINYTFSIFGQKISLVTQYEVTKQMNRYTEEEATEIALSELDKKISMTLKEKEVILEKKVLKKEVNNSTMNIEVFVSVLEDIAEVQEFVKEKKEISD